MHYSTLLSAIPLPHTPAPPFVPSPCHTPHWPIDMFVLGALRPALSELVGHKKRAP